MKQELLHGVSSIKQPGTEDYTESFLKYHLVALLMKKDQEAAKVRLVERNIWNGFYFTWPLRKQAAYK